VRVYVYPADQDGCGRYRMIFPARALRAQGHDVRIILPRGRTGAVGLTGMQDEHGNLLSVQPPADADVMVFQRITQWQLAQAIPFIRDLGVAVVVDMDDDLTAVDPRNVAWTAMHPRYGRPGQNWANATRACLAATLVTVSAQALLRVYAPHGRAAVLENRIPRRYLDVPHDDSDVIGWPGSVHSHPGDLPVVGQSVGRLVREGHRFMTVGTGLGVQQELGLEADPPASGLVPIEMWPNAVAQLGVGMAPLADTRFNAGKSALKPLEMSACGVPWVASPRAEYTRLHRHGVGRLAAKPRDWYRELKTLATDAALRRDMSERGRAVAAEHTIEGHAWRWLEAWETALKMQRAHAATVVAGG
jgi:hypothetical protein